MGAGGKTCYAAAIREDSRPPGEVRRSRFNVANRPWKASGQESVVSCPSHSHWLVTTVHGVSHHPRLSRHRQGVPAVGVGLGGGLVVEAGELLDGRDHDLRLER